MGYGLLSSSSGAKIQKIQMVIVTLKLVYLSPPPQDEEASKDLLVSLEMQSGANTDYR